jgi:hypothetical protein
LYKSGRAVNRVSSANDSVDEKDTANPNNNQRVIFQSAGTTESIRFKRTTAASFELAATTSVNTAIGAATIDVSWY